MMFALACSGGGPTITARLAQRETAPVVTSASLRLPPSGADCSWFSTLPEERSGSVYLLEATTSDFRVGAGAFETASEAAKEYGRLAGPLLEMRWRCGVDYPLQAAVAVDQALPYAASADLAYELGKAQVEQIFALVDAASTTPLAHQHPPTCDRARGSWQVEPHSTWGSAVRSVSIPEGGEWVPLPFTAEVSGTPSPTDFAAARPSRAPMATPTGWAAIPVSLPTYDGCDAPPSILMKLLYPPTDR